MGNREGGVVRFAQLPTFQPSQKSNIQRSLTVILICQYPNSHRNALGRRHKLLYTISRLLYSHVLVYPLDATEAASLRRLPVYFEGDWDRTQSSKAKPKRGYNICGLSDLLEMKHGSM